MLKWLKDKLILTDIMDYKKGQIYCIRSHQTNQIYIGSTISPLYKRFYEHKCTKDCSSKEIMQYLDAYIELLEDFPCNSKKELNRREGQHIRNSENCVNKRIEGRTQKEYYEENKEDAQKYKKEWYDANKERLKVINKEYYETHKEQIAIKNKEYRDSHKEEKSLKAKQYYLKKKFESTLEQLPSCPSP